MNKTEIAGRAFYVGALYFAMLKGQLRAVNMPTDHTGILAAVVPAGQPLFGEFTKSGRSPARASKFDRVVINTSRVFGAPHYVLIRLDQYSFQRMSKLTNKPMKNGDTQ